MRYAVDKQTLAQAVLHVANTCHHIRKSPFPENTQERMARYEDIEIFLLNMAHQLADDPSLDYIDNFSYDTRAWRIPVPDSSEIDFKVIYTKPMPDSLLFYQPQAAKDFYEVPDPAAPDSEGESGGEGLDFWVVFNIACHQASSMAEDKGFWSGEAPKLTKQAEKIALMHSELSEALEALRHGNPPDKHCPQFSSLEVELADVLIRLMDFAGHYRLDVGGAAKAKLQVNASRPYKHGKGF